MEQLKELKELLELSVLIDDWFDKNDTEFDRRAHEILPINSLLRSKIKNLIININKKANQAE
jgi:hypothetical protein